MSYEVYWKSQPTPREFQNTQLGLMEDLVEGIVGIVMNERLAEISAAPDAPFLAAGFGFGNLCETCYATFGQAVCKEDNTLAGFERLMTEIEKMKRFGFTDNEVERAKTELLSQYEAAMKQAGTRKNAQFVNPLIYNFFDNEPFMDPATEYEYANAILQQLSAPLINQGVAELIGPENMVVLYTAPEREGMVHPTADEIKAVITGVENAEIERPAGEDVPEAFLDAAKTEREACAQAVKLAEAKGFTRFSFGDKLAAGDKLLVIIDKDEDLKSSLEKMGITQYMWDRRS